MKLLFEHRDIQHDHYTYKQEKIVTEGFHDQGGFGAQMKISCTSEGYSFTLIS